MSVFRSRFYLLICAIKISQLILLYFKSEKSGESIHHSHFTYRGAEADGAGAGAAGGTATTGAVFSCVALAASGTALSVLV
ncbi:Uncharacterised protein [Acinetobacter baumannii]|nr:Uncharacterised protein [Acinetobacter baumannii]